MKYIIILATFLLVAVTSLNAESMYSLDGIKKVFLVVEGGGKDVSKKHKQQILEQLKETTDDLGIDTSGYDQRSLAVLIGVRNIGTSKVISVRLVIGEQVLREGSSEKVFAITYADKTQFELMPDEDMEDSLEDSMDTLLGRFSSQYEDENVKINKVVINDQDFATAMGYGTNYEAALKRAKKEHKNIMLVMVTNSCPWCRKFEQRVLLKKDVNQLVQKHYIPLLINKDKDRYPKELDRSFTPIVHFISYKTAKSYALSIGYNNRETFWQLLKKGAKK